MDELSLQKMYDDLLEREALDSSIMSMSKGLRKFDPEDAEVFVTSKEIAKSKREAEEPFSSRRHHEPPEVIHFKKYSSRRIHKYTEKEMEAIRASCVNSIVHDYGTFDWYHVSDEERAKHDELAEISLKLAKLKRTYRRVDQYIEAMRVVFQAWEILSNLNFVHTKEEFFKMVSKGNIVSNRIIMPKLKSRSNYNMDMIIGYISNPSLDVSHLAPKIEKFDDLYLSDDEMEDHEEELKRLLSPEEAEYVNQHEENPEPIKIKFIKDKMIKGYDERNLKRRKKENKSEYKLRKDLADVLKRIEKNNIRNYGSDWSRSFMVSHSIFGKEEKEKDFWERFPFKGSWSSKKDIFLYTLATDIKSYDEISNERYVTLGDRQREVVFRALEDAGMNTIDLRRRLSIDTSQSVEKASKKENKKMEAAIIARIEKLNASKRFKKIAKKAEEALLKHNERG